MQYARCVTDGVVWEADKFSALSSSVMDGMRDSLICVECGEFAWFRKASKHGHPPHFCASHQPECALKTSVTVLDQDAIDGEGQNVEELEHDTNIIVNLDNEQGGDIDVPHAAVNPERGGYAGRRSYVIGAKGNTTDHHFTLRRVLYRLVQSPDFRTSSKGIIFYKRNDEVLIQGLVRDVIISFADINESHAERVLFFWGQIASAKVNAEGKIWLNSSIQTGSASIAIFQDISEEFLSIFNIDDLEDLKGAHVLIAGRCKYSAKMKPIIWCGSPKYIVIRRYRLTDMVEDEMDDGLLADDL